MSTKKVHNTHIVAELPKLHRSLIDIMATMNEPERDEVMLKAAGLALERALFPLLVSVERLGPVGVVELAGRVGRDYTTVSRQIARLEEIGLVQRRSSATDKRVKEAEITASGKIATDAIDRTREAMAVRMFRDWSARDFDELIRLMQLLASGMRNHEHLDRK
ncbi:MarR family winged helix-turn-helix transcriptional regulator [Sphingomonas sp. TX0543]|uniref:MarR family winged helix-turn-helix transcriptional regulator n=1 Tax=Sphingomonas sp. TX0543 TaxID=3399682 RepID=UPI003AFA3D9A